ncbi:hypothetical protein ABE527_10265 [Brucella sp. TWI432]
MPFRSDQFIGTYNPDQLKALQTAYHETCALLGRTTQTEAEVQELAKRIYHIYDSGIEDPTQIARIIKHAESI